MLARVGRPWGKQMEREPREDGSRPGRTELWPEQTYSYLKRDWRLGHAKSWEGGRSHPQNLSVA